MPDFHHSVLPLPFRRSVVPLTQYFFVLADRTACSTSGYAFCGNSFIVAFQEDELQIKLEYNWRLRLIYRPI